MTKQPSPAESIASFYGESTHASDWLSVSQEMINQFGESTGDKDWLHTDPERAKRESPFGGTIAYGFWTISMLTYLCRQTFGRDYPEGALYGLNYGFDRIRMVSPVPVGGRIRNHMRLVSVEDRGAGRFLVKTDNRVEIEGVEKPAMLAEWLCMFVFPNGE
ncbi:MAG: MaoC family dehydratase [Planctomycetales bacterium]|nr:MaoC family dehydratase [Planctomycetales bacterium]